VQHSRKWEFENGRTDVYDDYDDVEGVVIVEIMPRGNHSQRELCVF
jgi:hypothetical protein